MKWGEELETAKGIEVARQDVVGAFVGLSKTETNSDVP